MNYDYEKQLDEIDRYLRGKEKSLDDFKIGVEFEHFVVNNEDLSTVTYWDSEGVESILKELEKNGWTGSYEGSHILGAEKGDKVVSLEPGSQFEFSITAKKNIGDLIKEYREFMVEIGTILDKNDQSLVALGYHPKTKIDDIKILPKDRYDYMFDYFKDKGIYAHNMMKGTASLQVSMDYSSEKDYRKKVRLANALAPIMYGISDSGYFFEGEKFKKKSLRTLIWNNMDNARSGTIDKSLDEDFSYRDYAAYVLDVPPILVLKDGKFLPTGNKKMREVFDPKDYNKKELEHMMTMVFPDVRAKGFIEIRMMDAIPYPYNFGLIAVLKNIFYNEDVLNYLDERFKGLGYEDIVDGKNNIIEKGVAGLYYGRPVIDWGKEILDLVYKATPEDEKKIIMPFKELIEAGKNPYMLMDGQDEETIKNLIINSTRTAREEKSVI